MVGPKENAFYVGNRVNIEVGQIVFVSCFLWHATAMPLGDERGVCCSDARLHISWGCDRKDIDGKNVQVYDRDEALGIGRGKK